MKSNQTSSGAGRIRPDLKVGKLAKLAFETYFQHPDRQEIIRLQDGDYCYETFGMKRKMPVMKPVDDILHAPRGSHVGEADFLDKRYWKQEYLVEGVKYRLVNDWHEPPNHRDNRTPLEDWIRRMGLVL